MLEYRVQHRTQQGAAMVVAIVVSMVIMVFSLTLLLAAYALYSSVQGGTVSMQCRELAASLSAETGQEIMGQVQDGDTVRRTPLYSYLRALLWQEEVWPHYDPENTAEQDECYRYFSLELPEGYEDMADEVFMTLYWTVEERQEIQEEEGGASYAVLHVRIKVSKNEGSYVTEKSYVLHVSRNGDEERRVDTEYGTNIDANECWSFSDLADGA